MDTCQYENELDAYHDGELSDQRRVAFEQALGGVPALCERARADRGRTPRAAGCSPARPTPCTGRRGTAGRHRNVAC